VSSCECLCGTARVCNYSEALDVCSVEIWVYCIVLSSVCGEELGGDCVVKTWDT
jgi:hypothetical protein